MTEWTKDFFVANRQKLAGLTSGGLVVLAGNVELQRRNDMAYRFSQESNFWYLTGINEPGWRMMYDGTRDRCWLIRPSDDEVKRTFDGYLDDSEALALSGADEVVAWQDQEQLMRQQTRRHSTVYALDPHRFVAKYSFVTNPAIADTHAVLSRIFPSVADISQQLANQRAVKSRAEVAAIRRAVDLTVRAFQSVEAKLATLRYEYEIEAEFTYLFRRHGADHAYDPIVASAGNACTLHYVANQARRPAYGAVLIDIGAQVDSYCADITRSYLWGKPTKRLRQLHTALEAAHHEIIKNIVPHMPLADYQRMVDKVMKRQMVDAGMLIDGDDTRYRRYFPHAISHGLGIDVHDSLGTSRTLKPGMVLTVEPGFYLPDELIGLRIEDDILITDDGTVNLSAKLSTRLGE